MVYIVTDYQDDLSKFNNELVTFKQVADRHRGKFTSLFLLPYIWHICSRTGCSCGFRNDNPEIGFIEPEDWFPEDEDSIKATRQVYKTLSNILKTGSRIDCLSAWSDAENGDIKTIEISFKEIKEKQFRFFTNYLFKITG